MAWARPGLSAIEPVVAPVVLPPGHTCDSAASFQQDGKELDRPVKMPRRAPPLFLACCAFTLILPASVRAAKSDLPNDARVTLNATVAAAKAKDWAVLRSMMVSKFTWSFGDEADAEAAIAEWKREPRYPRGLLTILSNGCHMKDAQHVECPGRGDMSFRAGLVKEEGKWRLQYFVEGD